MARRATSRYHIIKDGSEQSGHLKQLDKQKSTEGWEKAHPANINHIVWNIVAKRRTGKSTLILNTLFNLYPQHFTTIYLISPTAEQDEKYDTLVSFCKKSSSFYTSIDVETINNIIARIKDEIERYKDERVRKPHIAEPKNLIILDDCAGSMGTRVGSGNPLDTIYNNSAHLKLSVWTSVQMFRSLLPSARKNCDMYSFFGIGNQTEFSDIVDEVSVPKHTFIKAYSQVVEVNPDEDDEMNDRSTAPFLHIHWLRVNNTPTLFNCYDRLDVPFEDLKTTQQTFTSKKDSYAQASKFDTSGSHKTIYD